MRRGRAAALLLLVALAVSLLAAEFATRKLGLLDRVAPFPRTLFSAGASPDLPYRLTPGADVRVGDVRVRVNRLGLRGPEVDATPGAQRRRVLVLGDSVAYGHLLPESDSFPALLEHALRRRDPRFEVLNGAAPGYNTAAEFAFLRDVGVALRPQALVLGVSLNDFGPAPQLTPLGFLVDPPGSGDGPSRLVVRSELYALLRWAAFRLRVGGFARGEDDSAWAELDRKVGIQHKRFYADPSGPGWESLRRSLRAIRDLAAERRIDLVVVIFPERDQVAAAAPNLDPQRRWETLCSEFGLACVDPHAAFASAAAENGEPLFLDTQHPNRAGLAIAARATAAALAP